MSERWMVVDATRTPVQTDMGRLEADHVAARYNDDNPFPLLKTPFRVVRDIVAETS